MGQALVTAAVSPSSAKDEVANIAGDIAVAGEKEQELTAPAKTMPNQEQSPGDRSRFAQARRQAEAERDLAVAKAEQQIAKLQAKLAKYGNDLPSEPVARRQLADLQSAANQAEIAAVLAQADLEQATAADNNQAEDDGELQQRRQWQEIEQSFGGQLPRQLAQLQSLAPQISQVAELAQHPEAKQIIADLADGCGLREAYALAELTQLTKEKQQRQQIWREAATKQHLRHTAVGGSNQTLEIPPETLRLYQTVRPGRTLGYYQAHYRAAHQGK